MSAGAAHDEEDDVDEGEVPEEVRAERQARAEGEATAAEAALQKQEREDAERPGKEQSVLCTLRKGWAVAARRLAQIAALRGKSRERHKEFSVKRIKGRGPGAETKEIFANIPDSFDTLVGKAAKDNNQLQHKINVHEHALE